MGAKGRGHWPWTEEGPGRWGTVVGKGSPGSWLARVQQEGWAGLGSGMFASCHPHPTVPVSWAGKAPAKSSFTMFVDLGIYQPGGRVGTPFPLQVRQEAWGGVGWPQ